MDKENSDIKKSSWLKDTFGIVTPKSSDFSDIAKKAGQNLANDVWHTTKAAVFDTLTDMLNALLFPGQDSPKRLRNGRETYHSLNARAMGRSGPSRSTLIESRASAPQSKMNPDPSEMLYDSREQAQQVLEYLQNYAHKYETTSCMDLYTYVDAHIYTVRFDFTSNDIGWIGTSVFDNVRVKPSGGMYYIPFPETTTF